MKVRFLRHGDTDNMGIVEIRARVVVLLIGLLLIIAPGLSMFIGWDFSGGAVRVAIVGVGMFLLSLLKFVVNEGENENA